MAAEIESSGNLNEQQVIMLRLLKNPLPEEDFLQMRKLAVKLLSKKLDEVIGNWEEKQNITSKDYKNLGEGHFRSKS
ncbi:hypothetical protein C8P68_102389 [Mucilaginibacter yixingensis]|uniref:Uncharacterized protein n=1 Tax=Mucilaginibacter yixingensis TaxID=1295612 RepID=A0A2T5JCS9_9SPHI|nr:hypothetical protein [Mucilaginibacter yixingensis]PTQ99564.1 hypothetical protein C8P68_102389 [Mucilaginibacter yixingensis]